VACADAEAQVVVDTVGALKRWEAEGGGGLLESQVVSTSHLVRLQ
jgi:hypothetical protein